LNARSIARGRASGNLSLISRRPRRASCQMTLSIVAVTRKVDA
jgi:hypothetical protein